MNTYEMGLTLNCLGPGTLSWSDMSVSLCDALVKMNIFGPWDDLSLVLIWVNACPTQVQTAEILDFTDCEINLDDPL